MSYPRSIRLAGDSHPLAREALLAAAAAASSAAALAWFGPPGSTWLLTRTNARSISRRFHALEQLLVRGALQLRYLQRSLLPACGAARDSPPGSRDCRGSSAGVRDLGRSGVRNVGALVKPDVRRRLLQHRPRGGVPVRAGSCPRPARPPRSATAVSVGLCRAGRVDIAASALAFILLAIVTAGVGLGKRIGARKSFIPAAALVTVGFARVPALAPVPLQRALSVLGRGSRRRVRLQRRGRGPDLAPRARTCAADGPTRLRARLHRRLPRPSALGSNITRLQLFAIPIVVLVASLRSWRPLPICWSPSPSPSPGT